MTADTSGTVNPYRLAGATVGSVAKLSDHFVIDLDCTDGTSIRLTVTELAEVGQTLRTNYVDPQSGRADG